MQPKLAPKFLYEANFINFLRQLLLLLNANFTLLVALQSIAEEDNRKWYQQSVLWFIQEISNGKMFAQVLLPYKKYLNSGLLQLLHVAQQYAILAPVIQHYIENYDIKQKTNKNITKRFIYPLFILFIAFLVLVLLAETVVPQFKELFQAQNKPLPWLTDWIFTLAIFLRNYLGAILFGGSCFIGLSLLLKYPILGLKAVRTWFVKIPLINQIIAQKELPEILKIMALLLQKQVKTLDMINTLITLAQSPRNKQAFIEIKNKVSSGYFLTAAMDTHNILPKYHIVFLDKAEKSGSLAMGLQHISQIYTQKYQLKQTYFLLLLEPVLVSILSLFAGILILGLYLPIFSIGSLV